MVGDNGRHQVTLKALEEFHKLNPDINVKAEYTGWEVTLAPDHANCRRHRAGCDANQPELVADLPKNGEGFYDLNKMKDDRPEPA